MSFESARECLDDMITACNEQLSQEEKNNEPNLVKIDEMKSQISTLIRERRELKIDDEERIGKILQIYPSYLRAYTLQK